MAGQPAKNLIPLYGSVAKTIKNRILTGQYDPGAKLASEENIGREMGVSRITIRQAFAQLEEEGWITRQRGRGTFVSQTTPKARQQIMTKLQDIVQMIAKSRVKPLQVGKVKVKDSGMANDIRRYFSLSSDDEIGLIKRIIRQQNGSQHLVENFMAVELVDLVSMKEIREKKNILRILHGKTDLSIGRAEAFIEAVAADQGISDILGCQVMEPFICTRMYLNHASGEPLEIVNYYIRAESYKYRFEITTDDLDLTALEKE